MAELVHIAGEWIQIDSHLRQRCGWCGATLVDVALDRVAVPVGQDPRPATWPLGALVLVDGNMSAVIKTPADGKLPDSACGRLDPEVTR